MNKIEKKIAILKMKLEKEQFSYEKEIIENEIEFLEKYGMTNKEMYYYVLSLSE